MFLKPSNGFKILFVLTCISFTTIVSIFKWIEFKIAKIEIQIQNENRIKLIENVDQSSENP